MLVLTIKCLVVSVLFIPSFKENPSKSYVNMSTLTLFTFVSVHEAKQSLYRLGCMSDMTGILRIIS